MWLDVDSSEPRLRTDEMGWIMSASMSVYYSPPSEDVQVLPCVCVVCPGA